MAPFQVAFIMPDKFQRHNTHLGSPIAVEVIKK